VAHAGLPGGVQRVQLQLRVSPEVRGEEEDALDPGERGRQGRGLGQVAADDVGEAQVAQRLGASVGVRERADVVAVGQGTGNVRPEVPVAPMSSSMRFLLVVAGAISVTSGASAGKGAHVHMAITPCTRGG